MFPNALPELIFWFPHCAITASKITWQYRNICFSSALHLNCFYKNLALSGFQLLHIYTSLNVLNVSFSILSWNIKADSSVFVLFFPNDLETSSPFVLACTRSSRTSLDAAAAVKKQTSSKGFIRTMDWPNYFPIDFLASWVAQDPHEQYQMSGLEPYASDSRDRLFCTRRTCNICSLHRHWHWIPSVCLCHFLSSLVHKNSAKWIWLAN